MLHGIVSLHPSNPVPAIRFLLGLLVLSLSACFPAARATLQLPPAETEPARSETLTVAMSDGVELHTEVYFPEGEGPWPVILIRNPYNFPGGFGFLASLFSRYGYVGIHQFARGRSPSEGEWDPFMNERNDGIDTLQWIVDQPWQNGNIGLFGASYLSMVQWAVADVLPPEVKTMVPMVWGNDVKGLAFEGGMFRHEIVTVWAALMHGRELDHFNASKYHEAKGYRPHALADEDVLGKDLPWYRGWTLSAAGDAPLWKTPEVGLLRSMPGKVTVPVLMVGGWYDIFIRSQLEDFNQLATRDRSRFVVGPWTHLLGGSGDGDLPLPNAMGGAEIMQFTMPWFDHHLKGRPLPQWGPVSTYAINDGRWYHWNEWPPRVEQGRLHLREAARSNDCESGRLEARAPRVPEAVSYVYDPNNPVPSRGGSALLAFAIPGWGGALPSMRHQGFVCLRDDVLTFTSGRFTEDTHLLGDIAVRLTVSSDVEDTAFTAKIIDVAPDGKAVNIQDTITSLAYRNGATMPVSYTPGEKVTLDLKMWPTHWVVKKGHRLRIDISSSNWPAYHAHSNYPGRWELQAAVRPATQTVHTGGGDEGWVSLPIWRKTSGTRPVRISNRL